MNEQTVQGFARQVAACMGFEWRYVPPMEPAYDSLGEIAGPEGCAVRLRGDGYNWTKSERVKVWGTWPESIRRRDGQLSDFMPYRDNRPTPITCAISRGPSAVAKDILRRYMPTYLPQWRKQVQFREQALRNMADLDAAYEELAEAINLPVPSNGKLRLPFNDDRAYGTIELSTYKGMTARLDVHNIPMDKALEIARILAG